MEDCIFCKIVKKEIPAEIIFENDDMMAFLDINPFSYGHTLLIPKSHYQWMTDTPDSLIGKMFIETKNLMTSLKQAMGADFVKISVVGTDVPHFHIHAYPRTYNDGLKNTSPTKTYNDKRHMEEIGNSIRENLL
jgi:histidine triad (HIT) family protein